MSHSQNAGYFEINGAGTPPLSSGGIDMSEALYSGPKIDGYYWYFENDKRRVVEYRGGLIYFCGDPILSQAGMLKGELHKVPEPA